MLLPIAPLPSTSRSQRVLTHNQHDHVHKFKGPGRIIIILCAHAHTRRSGPVLIPRTVHVRKLQLRVWNEVLYMCIRGTHVRMRICTHLHLAPTRVRMRICTMCMCTTYIALWCTRCHFRLLTSALQIAYRCGDG